MQVAICGPNLNDQSKGEFHVHAAGCADLKHYGGSGTGKHGGEEPWVVEVASRYDVEAAVYDFAPSETPGYELGDYQGEFHFAPCTKDLPVSGKVDGAAAPKQKTTTTRKEATSMATQQTNSAARKQKAAKAGKCQLCGEKTSGYSVIRSDDGSYHVRKHKEGTAFYCKDHAERKVKVREWKAAQSSGTAKRKPRKATGKAKPKPKAKRTRARKASPKAKRAATRKRQRAVKATRKAAAKPKPQRKRAPKAKAAAAQQVEGDPFS